MSLYGAVFWLSILLSSPGADPVILQQHQALAATLPLDAWAGPGVWCQDGWLVATGQSASIDALGAAKGRGKEEEIALEDAKRRLLIASAQSRYPDFDESLYMLLGDVENIRTAAVYRLPPSGNLFLVVVAQASSIRTEVKPDLVKGGKSARSLFAMGEFVQAAKLFSKLTELGAQDRETVAYAKAASAEVNLRAGAQGVNAENALKLLGEFYESKGDLEASLKVLHQLYLRVEKPEKWLVEKLADLSLQTHRPNSAAAFKKELITRWPPPVKP